MEIQPRRFGDVLADLITMLGRVWRPLLMPTLVATVVLAVASYAIFESGGGVGFYDIALNQPEVLETMSDQELVDLFIEFARTMMAVIAVTSVVYGFIYLASARAVGDAVAAQPSGRSVSATALSLILPWIVVTVVITVGIALGMVLLVVPGIWLAVSMSMVAPIMALEGAGPFAALRRSYLLVKGNWWETLGFLLLIGLIGGAASQLVQLVALPALAVGSVTFGFGIVVALSVAALGLIVAAIAVGIAVWYLNLRARAEGPFVLQVN